MGMGELRRQWHRWHGEIASGVSESWLGKRGLVGRDLASAWALGNWSIGLGACVFVICLGGLMVGWE